MIQVCEKLQGHLWISGRDDEGPYIKHANQWIGYEDPLSITAKMAFVRSSRLGGVSLFNLNFDDIQVIDKAKPKINQMMILLKLDRVFVASHGPC